MAAINHRLHKGCIACGPGNAYGLRLKFVKNSDGGVSATVFCRRELSGYEGLLHGGVSALMLDSSMANCLFAAGITALTAELTVKYKFPVVVGRAADLRAWISADLSPLYVLKAELLQDGEVKVSSEAKFMKYNNAA